LVTAQDSPDTLSSLRNMTLHLRTSSWRNTANLLMVPTLALGALTACSDSTGTSGNEPGRIHFISYPYPQAVSPDGKTVMVQDPFSGTNDVYFYDVATHRLSLQTQLGSNPSDLANGLSNNGVIAASYGDPVSAAFWSKANGWTVIPSTWPTGCDAFVADGWDVSADGSVVVGMDWSNCHVSAWRWTNGTKTALELLGAPFPGDTTPPSNRPTVVSDDGTIAAGFAQTAAVDRYPAMWASDGSGSLIPTGGVFADDCPGEVTSISADGSVLGGTWCQHAFYWSQASGVVDIGRLPESGDFDVTVATAVTNGGNLIFGSNGGGFFGTPPHAFVWTAAKGMRQLQEAANEYLVQIPAGYSLLNVTSASADGTVVIGQAVSADGSFYGTYVLTVPLVAYGL
jgi:hypothetical protein